MLSEVVYSGKVSLPDDLSDELFILNMEIQNAAGLERGADTLWTDELYLQLADFIDFIRTTINPDTGGNYTLDDACKDAAKRSPFKDFKHPKGSKRKGLKPTPTTYRDVVKVRNRLKKV